MFGVSVNPLLLGAVVLLLVGLVAYMMLREPLGFRYLRPIEPGAGPLGMSKLFMPSKYSELPVGGQAPRLGGTSTWFGRGNLEGGMDNLRDATAQGFSRPARLDVYQLDGPAPADSVSTVVPVNSLMPVTNRGQGGSNLLGAVPTVGPTQPVLTSQNDRNRDLSGRSDVAIPVAMDEGGFNNSSTPTDTRTADSVPLAAAQGPSPAVESLRRRMLRR